MDDKKDYIYNISFDLDFGLKLRIGVFEYRQGSYPIACDNPSSPNYSDFGSDEVLEYDIFVASKNGKSVKLKDGFLDEKTLNRLHKDVSDHMFENFIKDGTC